MSAEQEPIGWLHTLHMELGQTERRFTFSAPQPFGLPGKHYSAEYKVTSEPVYTAQPPTAPVETGKLRPAQGAQVPSEAQIEAAWHAFENCPIDLVGDSDEEQKKCVIAAVKAALAAHPHEAPVARRLKSAAEKALNYIENTENELGIKLSCGDALREVLK